MKIVLQENPPKEEAPGKFYSVIIHGRNDIQLPVERHDRPHGFPISEALNIGKIYSSALGLPFQTG